MMDEHKLVSPKVYKARISRLVRGAIYRKYDCRCAYCGKYILYKDMQVDHLRPQCSGGNDDYDNLMPSCRRCNHYKRSYVLEDFRQLLTSLHEKITKAYINKIAIDYGIITIHPFDGVFYFENIMKNTLKTIIDKLEKTVEDISTPLVYHEQELLTLKLLIEDLRTLDDKNNK